MNRVGGTLEYGEITSVDMAIEAAAADVSLKQKILTALAQNCRPDCVLATNMGPIHIGSEARCNETQRRTIGILFLHPMDLIPMVEIIRTEHSTEQVHGRQATVGVPPVLLIACPAGTKLKWR